MTQLTQIRRSAVVHDHTPSIEDPADPSKPFALPADAEAQVEELIARYPLKRAAALPLLHMCQKRAGWVSPEILVYVAKRLDLSTSEVKGIATFYTMYHRKPVAQNVIWVCRTLSCELMGAKTIQEHLEKRFGCGAGETSQDGKFTLLKAECLAACGQGPMVQLNDDFHENLTIEKLDRILDHIAASASPNR